MEKNCRLLKKLDNKLRNAKGDINIILEVAKEVSENNTPEISKKICKSILILFGR